MMRNFLILNNRKRESISLVKAKNVITNKTFLIVCIIGALTFFSRFGFRGTLIPLYTNQNLGMGVAKIGALLTTSSVANLITTYPSGWLSDKYSRKPLLLISALLTGLTVLMIPFFANELSLWILMVFNGLASGTFGVLMAWVADTSPKELMSISMGLNRTIASIGTFLGPLILGYVIDTTIFNNLISYYPF